MLRRIMATPRKRFAMCLARRRRTSETDLPFYEYGTILELMHVQTLSDGRSMVQAVGSHRFKVLRTDLVDGYHMADIERIDDIDPEQEAALEQQQILNASASRARQSTVVAQLRPSSARPISMSNFNNNVIRPAASAPRPMSMMMGSARPQIARPQMIGQRQSWAQQAHPQTQTSSQAPPWLQMHVRGLSAASNKQKPQAPPQRQPQPQPQPQPQSLPILIPEKVVKNRQEQSTEELMNDLVAFLEKLLLHKSNQNLSWLNALGDPPTLRGPSRDRVVLTWWIVNMMPLGEDEKYQLLPMRSIRERILQVIAWVDRFEDQWSLFLNNQSSSCCIS